MLLQGALEVEFSYDKAGRVSSVEVQDQNRNTGLTTNLLYDDFDRETERTVLQGTNPLYKLTQSYGATSLLTCRELENGSGQVLQHEEFEYDVHNRLEDYTCTVEEGDQPPVDDQGRPIRAQHFEFDEFDNIREVTTRFGDGSDNGVKQGQKGCAEAGRQGRQEGTQESGLE